MKLEVGMYVRNHLGRIEKIKTLEPYNEKYCINGHEFSNNVLKVSHNIIDLIEVGDYVNGFPVEDYFHEYNEEKDIFENVGVITTECYLENTNFSWILEKDIKTILTKEQFESNSYTR